VLGGDDFSIPDLHCHRLSKMDAVQGCMERDVDYLGAAEIKLLCIAMKLYCTS
jgi:hypothetical protein